MLEILGYTDQKEKKVEVIKAKKKLAEVLDNQNISFENCNKI